MVNIQIEQLKNILIFMVLWEIQLELKIKDQKNTSSVACNGKRSIDAENGKF